MFKHLKRWNITQTPLNEVSSQTFFFFFGPQYCCLESLCKQPLVTLMKLRCSVWLLSHHKDPTIKLSGGPPPGSLIRLWRWVYCWSLDKWESQYEETVGLGPSVNLREDRLVLYGYSYLSPNLLAFFSSPTFYVLIFFTLMYILTFRPSGWLSGIGLSTYPELSNLLT